MRTDRRPLRLPNKKKQFTVGCRDTFCPSFNMPCILHICFMLLCSLSERMIDVKWSRYADPYKILPITCRHKNLFHPKLTILSHLVTIFTQLYFIIIRNQSVQSVRRTSTKVDFNLQSGYSNRLEWSY